MIHFLTFGEKEITATNNREGMIKEREKEEEKKDPGKVSGAALFAVTLKGQKKQ